WTTMGRANNVYTSVNSFAHYLEEHWQSGRSGEVTNEKEPGDWLKGIAILVHDKGEKEKKSSALSIAIGFDPSGIERVRGYGRHYGDALDEAVNLARDYIKKHPKSGPLALWKFKQG